MKPCPNCGESMPPSSGRGQPRRYCSARCRRAAFRRRSAAQTETALEAAADGQRGPWTEGGIEAFLGQLMGDQAA